VLARSSPYSLYRQDLATFGADDIYDQSDAAGFINLYGLPLKVRALTSDSRVVAQDQASEQLEPLPSDSAVEEWGNHS
jgi:hypothetical protein